MHSQSFWAQLATSFPLGVGRCDLGRGALQAQHSSLQKLWSLGCALFSGKNTSTLSPHIHGNRWRASWTFMGKGLLFPAKCGLLSWLSLKHWGKVLYFHSVCHDPSFHCRKVWIFSERMSQRKPSAEDGPGRTPELARLFPTHSGVTFLQWASKTLNIPNLFHYETFSLHRGDKSVNVMAADNSNEGKLSLIWNNVQFSIPFKEAAGFRKLTAALQRRDETALVSKTTFPWELLKITL